MRETKKIISINRKCGCCGSSICISKSSVDDAIFYDKKSYHRKCFIDICNKRAGMKRVDVAEKWLWVQKNINRIEKESRKHFLEAIYKEEVNQFIMEEYGLTVIPSSVWQKLSNIYTGSYRGMSIGISPDELIDMWKRKINYLNKVANQNVTKGKIMNTDQRIIYDLSVLINKYDRYKKWLESQKMLESDIMNNSRSQSISTSIINEVSKKNIDNYETEMTDLVDDIFD